MVNRSKSEEEIYYAALEELPDRRSGYVKAACGDDLELLERVESLLKIRADKNNFLESPLFMDQPLMNTLPEEKAGSTIDKYRLLEKIGEGGMAVVYMAEQTEPIRRKVALKIIKLGMDTKTVIARFEAERQALAMMDHPNIAKVLDAGATETGRPYFVMELVKGVSITDYCDANSLSTKERLELFIQVCNAVQHAHQKGIIHRDIKPTNVMVTLHDGKSVPKVIDFGIAKAINQKLTEKTLFTRYAHIIGTPAYMSPEQAELSDLDIDTRTDIYSLGVLLYELLTGTTPFGEEELRKAGYIEMQRVIREQEPVKPSTKLTTLGKTLTDVAKHRNSTPDLLKKAVRGDLDWIVMKSLEKDRARRYETANGLATDIRRHIEHEPVMARGPSTTYRLQKFLRRHRSQTVAALGVMVVAGSVTVILSMWNRDRLQLTEAEGFRHRGILSQAREQYAKAERDVALETIKPILNSRHVGPEAQLLYAGILVDNRRSDEAVAVLGDLLDDRPEIAGAAHSLLARILWESESPNAEKLKEIEEHRQKAETLLPETAEAYFLRAMTAVTVKEQLAALDRALQLDPTHYESRRLRAYTYYASRKYEKMKDDALVLTVLRPRNPLGYSLRAIGLRELGKYHEAILDYDVALSLTPKDSPQYLDLTTQRSETLLRMGRYEHVVTAAQEVLKLWPDKAVFQYHLFCALTALGEYDKANAVFREIVRRTPTSRNELREWCAKYVFDMLEAGRSWHPGDHVPTGPAFLPMVEAEETYRHLSAKGQRLIRDGFSARWSPDSKKLAFSLGAQGRSGIAVFDPVARETNLLIVPGKYPSWSPDGRHIAFVRDRQFLPVPEFVAADPQAQQPASQEEELWLMNSDGTEPRRLACGVWPSWSQDSACVYYKSRLDNTLYSISTTGQGVEPKRITSCLGWNPSVSPNGQHMASIEGSSLKVKDLVSQTVVGKWPLPRPSDGWGAPAWSPSGNEVCIAGSGGMENGTGLWIYRLDRDEPVKVLAGPITGGTQSPDGTKVAFESGTSCFEIWIADLVDPNMTTPESLGPVRTIREHLREMIAVHTRRVETDPLDAYAYSNRAYCYDCLKEPEKANADMRRWSAIISGSDLQGGAVRRTRRILNGPFNCQFVFSAERPVNLWLSHEIPLLKVALGRKGRCSMKSFQIPVLSASLLGLCLLSGLDAPARADFTFGKPVDVQSAFPLLDFAQSDGIACFSADGLEMYTDSLRSGGQGQDDIWVCKRASPEDDWGPLENLGPTINSAKVDVPGSLTADGLELYFYSRRSGSGDLYVTKRATRNSPWGPPTNLGAPVNTAYVDGGSVSSDGLELYVNSDRPGGYGGLDLYVSIRATTQDLWGDPVNLGPAVNSPGIELTPALSPDGLLLVFRDGGTRPGGYGGSDLWMTRRASRSAPWEPAVNLGPIVNGPNVEFLPCFAPDGSALYFDLSDQSTYTYSQWKAPILPSVDFNGDGKVDVADVFIMLEHWLTDYPLCDIGPMPWGDGFVDAQDLIVLAEYMANNPGDVNNVQ